MQTVLRAIILGIVLLSFSQPTIGTLLPPATTLDATHTAIVSFVGTRQVVALDIQAGELRWTFDLPRAPRDIALSATADRLFVSGANLLDEYLFGEAPNHRTTRLRGADLVAVGTDGAQLYVSRLGTTAIAKIHWTPSAAIGWTATVKGVIHAVAVSGDGATVGVAYGSGRVALLDAENGRVQRTLLMGRGFTDIALTASGDVLYALNQPTGILTAVTTQTGTTSAAAPVGRRPRRLALAPDERTLYVLDPPARSLIAVDAAHLSVLRTLRLPETPNAFAVSPDGGRIVITSQRARALFIVDAATWQVVQTHTFRHQPHRIVCAPHVAHLESLPTPTPTASAPPATPPLTDTPGGETADLATRTPSAAPTPTPIALTATARSGTATPNPQGLIVGEVFDDATAQPLAGVRAAIAGAAAVETDGDGRYLIHAPAGDQLVTLTKPGYTSSIRRVVVAPAAVAYPLDTRLSTLDAPTTIGTAGGTATAGSGQSGRNTTTAVELIIPAHTIDAATAIGVTLVSPQALRAPLPLGWSVLLAVEIQPASTVTQAGALLRAPLSLLSDSESLSLGAAAWDDAEGQWRAGPWPMIHGGTAELPLDWLPPQRQDAAQLALVVADAAPAPPAAVPGQALQPVLRVAIADAAGAVVINPSTIVTGGGAGTQVVTSISALQRLPSGTVLSATLREAYTLRDGQRLSGTVSTQDLIGYQVAPPAAGISAPPRIPGDLVASFPLVPSRTFPLTVLRDGEVGIEVALPRSPDDASAIGSEGGAANGADGLRLIVPPEVVNGTAVIRLHRVLPASLPGSIGSRTDFIDAVDIELLGDPLRSDAGVQLDIGGTIADGQQFIIARIDPDAAVPELMAFGDAVGGHIQIDRCHADVAVCLDGLSASGTYIILAAPNDAALVTGTVRDASAVRAGLVVRASTSVVASKTDALGRYLLAVPAGAVTVTCSDRERDQTAMQSVIVNAGAVLALDLFLEPQPPKVIRVVPPDHAGGISLDATVSVTFSEPLARESITEDTVQLRSSDDAVITTRLSLSSDATQIVLTPMAPLTPNAVYRLRISDALTDATGTPLNGNRPHAFESDFTTAPVFTAEALPANTLRVSLPDEHGAVLVCGGAQLAAPGTFVVVTNAAAHRTVTGLATSRGGAGGCEACDLLFSGRCDTAQPGSFCVVIEAAIGDHLEVQLEDVLHSPVTLDAGHMRDERTGATAIPPEGGVVTYPADPRYQVLVPDGAFAIPTVVQLTPITPGGVGLNLADFPALPSLDQNKLELVGALQVDFAGVAQRHLDVSVPAPPDATADDQYIATQVVHFRGRDEQTMIDTANFDAAGCALDPQHCLVATDPSPFPGIMFGGIFAVHRSRECLAFATGWVALGDHFTSGYIPGGTADVLLPLSILSTATTQFALPVPCDRPVDIVLTTFDDRPVDRITITAPPKGIFDELPRRLSDNAELPEVEGVSLPDGSEQVDIATQPAVAFNKPLDPASVTSANVSVVDSHGRAVPGGAHLSVDGRVITFTPGNRLRFGEQYRLSLHAIFDRDGHELPGVFSTSFTTFQLQVLGRIADVDARDVTAIDTAGLRAHAGQRLLAVAEGDRLRADFEGGLRIYDVSDLSAPPRLLAAQATAGIDRAVRFVRGPGLDTTGQHGSTYAGPFLMSIDGPGGSDRFGVWRLFDLSQLPRITPVAVRLVNQSADSWNQLNLDDSQGALLASGIKLIPNDLGIPEDLAATDTQIAYIANAPSIGLQAIVPQGMNADPLAGPQVDGTLTGLYRSVTTLKQHVLALRADRGESMLVLADPRLLGISSTLKLPASVRPSRVTALADWPIRVGPSDSIETPHVEPRDLAVVTCQGSGLCVVAVNTDAGTFTPELLSGGSGTLATPGQSPNGCAGDPSQGLLFVADGTAGLTAIDFASPGGAHDDDQDGVDDRVLGTLDLDGYRAVRVAPYVDVAGRPMVAVATAGGIYLVQVGPGTAGLTLFDTNNTEIVPERFKQNDGTFVLVNDDNDDGNFDENGDPILDFTEAGPVRGENDLRRIDVATPMTEGTLVVDIEAGKERAALWRSSEKGEALPLPAAFDLAAGQRPPSTIWLEALSPSAADRDIVVVYRWLPPAGVVADPIEDRVALTALALQFVPGQHGVQQPDAAQTSWRDLFRLRPAYAQAQLETKQLFPEAAAEAIEQVLRREHSVNDLPREMFGRVQLVGVAPEHIASISVHTTRGVKPDNGTIVDATFTAGPTAFDMVPTAAREAQSRQDALLYQGLPLGLAPEAVRQQASALDVLPVNVPDQTVAQTAMGVGAVLQTARPHPVLRRDPSKPAVLQVIDAQEFAAEIVAFKEGAASAAELRQAYAEKAVTRDDMDGALADGSSRLILRLELPKEDRRQHMLFKVEVDRAKEPAPVGNHFLADVDFPFGALTLTGVNLAQRTLELSTDLITTADGRHVFVAAFTPPMSFPYVDKPITSQQSGGAGRLLPLQFSIHAAEHTGIVAEQNAMLVRPPVIFVHGLFGDGGKNTWDPQFVAQFTPARFYRAFADYAALNTSGYDMIWRSIRRRIQSAPSTAAGMLDIIDGLRQTGIAAVKLDLVAHSMGGVMARWLATDDLGPSTARFVADNMGTTNGKNFQFLNAVRTPAERYLRVDNFNEGDVRSLVTIGSPIGGSPFANWVLRRAMNLDRLNFGVPPLPTFADQMSDFPAEYYVAVAAQGLVSSMAGGKTATPQNDVGVALMDLSMGSAASRALDRGTPGPMLVHAIATRANDPTKLSHLGLTALSTLVGIQGFCAAFKPDSSDGIVPEGSAFYGTDANGQSLFDGYDHDQQSKAVEVGLEISQQLLFDQSASPSGGVSINSFDNGFVPGKVPFECQ